MTVPQLLFDAALLACLVLCLLSRVRAVLPAFCWYVALALVRNMAPWYSKDPSWLRTWGLAYDAVALATLLWLCWELITLLRTRMLVREFRAVLWVGVLGISASASAAFWLYAPTQDTWYRSLMALRQFAGIELLVAMSVLTLYAMAAEVEVPVFVRVHGCLLCLWLAGLAVPMVRDPVTGLKRAAYAFWGASPWEAQRSLDTFGYLWGVACFTAWAFLLLRLARRLPE